MGLVIGFGQIWKSISYRIRHLLLQSYQSAYLLSKKEVVIEDPKTLQFRGRAILDIKKGSEVYLGKDVIINSDDISIIPSRTKIYVGEGGKLSIGNHFGISSSTIVCCNEICIGNYVNIGAGCLIMDSNMHSTNWKDRENRLLDVQNAKTVPIKISDYVFVGAKSVICKGVKIGEKSMIAAGSVVVKDIPANCIAGGNPCKVIRLLD